MHHAPLTELHNNHISFSTVGDSLRVEEIFTGFGVDAPTTDHTADLSVLRGQVTEFAKPYRHQTADSLAAEFRATTPDKWEALLDAAALEQVKAQIVRDVFIPWNAELRDQIKDAAKDANAYAEHIDALPLADTIATMIDAAKALRGTHHNANQAIDVDPLAYRKFRDAGRNLARLSRLLRFGGLTFTPNTNPETWVALYANPVDLPDLKASATKRAGVYEPYYSDADRQAHDQVVEARELIRGRHYDLFLAELAAGRWPALAFTVAETIPELNRRALVIADAGVIDHV